MIVFRPMCQIRPLAPRRNNTAKVVIVGKRSIRSSIDSAGLHKPYSDMMRQMDFRVGEILDAIAQPGVESRSRGLSLRSFHDH